MHYLIVDIRPWDKAYAIAALEGGADAVIVPDGYDTVVKELGLLDVIPERHFCERFHELDIEPGGLDGVVEAICQRGEREVLAVTDSLDLVSLENLVARNNRFFLRVRSSGEVVAAANLLDGGVYGFVLSPQSESDIKEVVHALRGHEPDVDLVDGEVTGVETAGVGFRAFVDTTCLMSNDQGMLIGNTTHGYFLVLSESFENPYTGKRPFRVNAGGLHAYTLKPGDLTQYLSELVIGEPVLIVDTGGSSEASRVGRVKIERRPLLLVRACYEQTHISHYFQNASTVHVLANGKPTPVTQLRIGDRVRMCVRGLEGRHYGMKIDETVVEK